MIFLKKIMFVLIFSLFFTLAACSGGSGDDQEPSHSVATSMYPLEFLVSEIAGDLVTVETVVPPGTDPHVYEPSSKKMIELSEHDAFFYIGAGMEAFGETLANAVSNEGVTIFTLEEHEELFADHTSDHDHAEHEHGEHEGHHHDVDPHFWLDPLRMSQAADITSDRLAELYQEHEEVFKENTEELKAELEQLDEEFQALQGEDYVLFVTHEAYGYWTERYGIEQLSVRGVSSSQEPSQKELQEIFDQVGELDIDHIILESNSQDRLAQTIAEEMELRVLYIHTLESLTEENVGASENYFDLMRENIETIRLTKQ